MILPLLIVVQTLTGVWSYSALDSKGHQIASGKISLAVDSTKRAQDRSPKTGYYLGFKVVTCIDQAKYGPHKEGSLPAKADKSSPFLTAVSAELGEHQNVSIDLNAGTFDNNIFLDGKLDHDKITGTWGWSGFAGWKAQGTFKMTRLVQPHK